MNQRLRGRLARVSSGILARDENIKPGRETVNKGRNDWKHLGVQTKYHRSASLPPPKDNPSIPIQHRSVQLDEVLYTCVSSGDKMARPHLLGKKVYGRGYEMKICSVNQRIDRC
jgi:hypothetical protein